MQLPDVISGLTTHSALVPAKAAQILVPSEPGLYSIFVDNSESLCQPYCDYLRRKSVPDLLYVGIAAKNLRVRLVDQDLRHRRASTFFRGIGAILGYRPQPGSLLGNSNQRNYRFSGQDTASIIEWIDGHLAVRWVAMKSDEAAVLESRAIRELRPLLNATHNPNRLPELAALRRECERIALAASAAQSR